MITFEPHTPNQLLVNPKWADQEKKTLSELKHCFESRFPDKDFFLIASSGSSKKEAESVKLIAIPRESVLNSAARFNQFFEAGSQDKWGLVLPTFHVAGLSILARAFLAAAEVYQSEWKPEKMLDWLTSNQIAFLSLVPAQVYDLVQLGVTSPPSMKKVFVGAGALSSTLKTEFKNLRWPVVETYGMTETCSMIAVRENEAKEFQLLPGVQVQINEGLLRIHCDSLAHSFIQKQQNQMIISEFARDWLQTEDQVRILPEGLEFLGRSSEYIKILGEGVSLLGLREKLDTVASSLRIGLSQKHLLAVPDSRLENLLVLIVESAVPSETAGILQTQFNQLVRGYEKIHKLIRLEKIPLTDLGKVKTNELTQLVLKQIGRRSDDKKI